MLRVVLDTNVIVSGLIKPAGVPGQIVTAWRNGAFRLVLPEFLLEEIAATLMRPKLARVIGWPPATADRFVLELRAACDVVEPAVLPLDYPRDPDDIPVLATLIAGKADVLVTGDADLLVLRGQFPVEAPREFVQRLG